MDTIFEFIKDMTEEEFKVNIQVQWATIRGLEMIGEGCKQTPSNKREKFPSFPWSDLSKFRDILIHKYIGTDITIVWNSVTQELQEAYKQLREIIKMI